MSKPRKTIDVEKVIAVGNSILRDSIDEMDGERRGVIHLLETLLMDAERYNGFRWITKGGEVVPTHVIQDSGEYDQTRRQYFFR